MSRLLNKFPMLHSVVSNVSWRMAERLIAVAFSIGIVPRFLWGSFRQILSRS
ncbi:MAG: hypothetical protein ACKVJU_17285 [Verrucomicrobiales bacterium]